MSLHRFIDRIHARNKNDAKLERQFFKEIAKLGYGRKYRRYVISCKTFAPGDNAVVPVILKYLDLFEREGCKLQFMNALGVKGFYEASEYLIDEYKKNTPPSYNQPVLNEVSQTLARIQDERFIDTYIEFISDNVTMEAGYIVEMLGNMKVEKAIPTLINLVDCVAIIPDKWYESVLEEQKFYVSHCAIKALGKFDDKQLTEHIEKFLTPEKLDWIKFENAENERLCKKHVLAEYKRLAEQAIKSLEK